MLHHVVPTWVDRVFPDSLWRMPEQSGAIYLTFDDGPSMHTPALLDLLDSFDAKATFFCLGEQIDQHPEILEEIKKRGHSLGLHGHAHLDAWKCGFNALQRDLAEAQQRIQSKLYRPPYGHFRRDVRRALPADVRQVMWSISPGDYELDTPIERIIERVTDHWESGSIIVLHDNERVHPRSLQITEQLLVLAQKKGLPWEALKN